MTMTIVDKDRGWKRIKSEVVKMNRAFVQVGVLQADGGKQYTRDNASSGMLRTLGKSASVPGATLAEVAFWNEFGTKNIPERSFVRFTVDINREKYHRGLANEVGKIFKGTSTVARSLGLIGQKVESDIKRRITTLKAPPNAASTIRLKGSSNPLIDTGRLRGSIRYKVEGA